MRPTFTDLGTVYRVSLIDQPLRVADQLGGALHAGQQDESMTKKYAFSRKAMSLPADGPC